MHYTKRNMRRRGPMESQKLQDLERQQERAILLLQRRMTELKEKTGTLAQDIRSGDAAGSIEGSLYRHAERAGRGVAHLERREENE